MPRSELIDLEEEGWRALSSTGEAATAFYDRVLDDRATMLLPGGLVLDDRATILRSMGGQPWSWFEIDGMRVMRPTPETGVVAYGVVAGRAAAGRYSALVSSHYVKRPDGWKLTFHQQTPR